jgi:hypothetical protein
MTTTRKSRKRKWIGATVFLLMAGLLPAQASSPSLPDIASSDLVAPECSAGGTNDGLSARMGTCDAGGNCCSGHEEAPCNGSGGGFYSV